MEAIDLSLESDRLLAASRAFDYPSAPHRRKHGPNGYDNYESYRDWLRDEFSYRCVFSLIRETWVGRLAAFDIDHLRPQATHANLAKEYDNLLYLTHRLNLIKGKRILADPCSVSLGRSLHIEVEGGQMGAILARDKPGEKIIAVLRLDSEDATEERRKWIGILRSLAQTDEAMFRELIGYPANLPNLRRKREQANSRKNGIEFSAQVLREEVGTLPDYY